MAELNVVDFYHGRSIFITGSTGFMGKILVEKLLRACTGIDKIYLLMRPMKGLDIDCRLQEIVDIRVINHTK